MRHDTGSPSYSEGGESHDLTWSAARLTIGHLVAILWTLAKLQDVKYPLRVFSADQDELGPSS